MFNRATIAIRVLVFLLIASGMWTYLNYVFATKDRFVNTAQAFKKMSAQSNIDVLLLGSSHVYTAINPEVINNESNTLSFNLGSDGLRFHFTGMILQEALKYTKPKLVIVEVFRGSVQPIETDVTKGFQLRALDFTSDFSAKKFALTNAHYDKNELLGVYFPLIRNHSNWAQVDYFNLDRSDQLETQYTTFYDGFLGAFNNISTNERSKYLDFKTKIPPRDTSKNYLEPEHIKEFEHLVALSKKHDFELLILTNPDLRATSINNHFYDQLSDYCEQYGLPYLNLNFDYDALDVTLDDFKDPAHLNFFGADKTSRALSQYINENYMLPDRSKEPFWQAKSNTYTAYLEAFSGGKEIYNRGHNDTLFDQIRVRNMSVKRSKAIYTFTIAFDSIAPKAVNNTYKLGVQIYPTTDKQDQLGEYSIESGRAFDNTSAVIYDLSKPLEIKLKTNVTAVDKIRFFVFDKAGYKGTLGTPLVLKGSLLDIN